MNFTRIYGIIIYNIGNQSSRRLVATATDKPTNNNITNYNGYIAFKS